MRSESSGASALADASGYFCGFAAILLIEVTPIELVYISDQPSGKTLSLGTMMIPSRT